MATVRKPNRCPRCAAEDPDGFTFRELEDRPTWAPVSFAENGDPYDYRAFDYSDEGTVTGYDCPECTHEWVSLAALRTEQEKGERLEDRYGFPLREILAEPTPVYLSILYLYGEPGERAALARDARQSAFLRAHGSRVVAAYRRRIRALADLVSVEP